MDLRSFSITNSLVTRNSGIRRTFDILFIGAISISAITFAFTSFGGYERLESNENLEATIEQPIEDTGQDVDHEVVLSNIRFKPNRLKVKEGDTVRFTNEDKFQHDVYLVRTANRNQIIIPATTLDPGKSTVVRIDQDGLFSLYCTIHGGMSGMISTTGTFELTEEEKAKAAALHVLPPSVKIGETLFWGKAQCHQCHSIGDRGTGTRGPNLQDIGFRAGPRAQKLGLDSRTAYIVQSLQEPSAYIVEGFSDDMPRTYQPPIDLSADELKAIVAYLQSQGGEVDDWGVDFPASLLDSEPAWNPFEYGSAERGKLVFENMKCVSCHTVGDRESISVGPDLSEIGKFRNWAWISQAIINPNAEIGANWQSATVFLEPDPDDPYGEIEEVFGILRVNDEKGIRLMVGHEKYETWTPDEVDHIVLESVSRMPTNFGTILSFSELSDLIAYVLSLKGDASQDAQTTAATTSK